MNAALPLPALDTIRADEPGFVEIRCRIQRNPELGDAEHAASDLMPGGWRAGTERELVKP